MLKTYPAILHDDEGYWIEFPDLEGCHTCGETLADTLEYAREALGLYLVSLQEDGQPIPEPSSMVDITPESGQTTYITTDLNEYRRDTRAVKKMISLPAWMAEEAETHNISLSKITQEALKKRLIHA